MLTPLGKFLRKAQASTTTSSFATWRKGWTCRVGPFRQSKREKEAPAGFCRKGRTGLRACRRAGAEPLFLRIRSKRMEHRDRRLVALEGRPKYRHRLRAKVFRPG